MAVSVIVNVFMICIKLVVQCLIVCHWMWRTYECKIYSVDHLEEFSVFSFSETKLAFVLVQVSNIP